MEYLLAIGIYECHRVGIIDKGEIYVSQRQLVSCRLIVYVEMEHLDNYERCHECPTNVYVICALTLLGKNNVNTYSM